MRIVTAAGVVVGIVSGADAARIAGETLLCSLVLLVVVIDRKQFQHARR